MSDVIEEEVVEELTPEEEYDAEYEKAWSDEEELEQPNEEVETDVDVPDETIVEEDSSNEEIVEEDKPVEETTESDLEEDKPSDDFAEVLKWNKQEIPVTREELISLAQKGFDSNKKWQEAAVDRPLKDIISKNGFTAEDLQLFADAKNGNAEAIAMLAKKANVDLYEAEHKDYVPRVEERNYELDDVITEINKDEAIATQMNEYVSNVPQSVKDVLVSQPSVLRGLNIDMQQGIAQKLMPEVIKQLAINPNQDFVNLYQQVGQAMYSKEETPKAEEKPKRVEATREEKRKMGVSTKNSAPTKVITDDYDAAWDDNKHFNEVLARMNGY